MSGITTPIIQGWSSKKSTPKSPEVYGKNDWLVVWTPLKNISQWEGLSHILWKIIQMFQSTKQMSSWRFHDRWFTSGKFQRWNRWLNTFLVPDLGPPMQSGFLQPSLGQFSWNVPMIFIKGLVSGKIYRKPCFCHYTLHGTLRSLLNITIFNG